MLKTKMKKRRREDKLSMHVYIYSADKVRFIHGNERGGAKLEPRSTTSKVLDIQQK